MVATRRNASKEPGIDIVDPELALRKKPVRRATVRFKKADTSSAPEPPRTRATRGKRAAGDLAPGENIADISAPEPGLPMRAKPTRRVGRPAKVDAVPSTVEELVTASAPAKKATKATRTPAARSKKPEVRQDQGLAETEVEEKPKSTARRTRATAPASKTQPLSPKKITQVTKPQTRNAKTKAKPAKSAPPGRTTRSRAVSDENEELPTLTATNDDEDDLVLLASTPVKRPSPVKVASVKKSTEVQDEDVMSSRSTTPADSPAPSFDELPDENEYHKPGKAVSATSDSEDEHEVPGEGDSEDELCGPKTPMKRTSPGAEARYLQSVQRTFRRAELAATPRIDTSLERKTTAIPQTHQATSEHTAPASEIRPPTVARGADRAMVFKQLQPLLPAAENDSDTSDGKDAATNVVHDSSVLSEDEAIAPMMILQSSPSSSYIEATELQMAEDTFNDNSTILDEVVHNEPIEEPDDTVLVHEIEAEDGGTATPAVEVTVEPQHAMVIDQAEDVSLLQASIAIEEEVESTHQFSASRTPETIPWDNLRQDVTIPFNFDAHFANITLGPEGRHADLQADERSVQFESEERQAAVSADIADRLGHSELVPVDEPGMSDSRDVTMNLNDFVDLAGLAGPTHAIERPNCTNVEDLLHETCTGHDLVYPEAFNADPGNVDDSDLETSNNTEADMTVPERFNGNPIDVLDLELEEEASREASLIQELLQLESQRAAPEDVEHACAVGDDEDISVPHYALPTFAFDARRRSLPAMSSLRTPVRAGTRPNTSDGASMPRVVDLFGIAQRNRSRFDSRAGTPNGTPWLLQLAAVDGAGSPAAPQRLHRTPQTARSERYPALGARRKYEERAKTALMPTRFRTPINIPFQRSNSAQKPSASAITPRASRLRPRPVPKPGTPVVETSTAASSVASSPPKTPSERFPRLGARDTYIDHAMTVAGTTRFGTPVQSPAKRPDTVQKYGSLRKVALKNSTPKMSFNTPIKTPLKSAAMTPGMAAMTPHPSAPLKGVVAMVEVYTNEGASASAPFASQLQSLGAKTTKVWSDKVTHVVFKDGSPTTLQRVRIHNKELEDLANAPLIYCVNTRWIQACDDQGRRVPESDEDFAVDLDEVPRGGRRRRKSMEPSALINVSGSIFCNRKGSIGRSSLGRSPLKYDSPTKRPSPEVVTPRLAGPIADAADEDKENSGADDQSSPVTPAYLAAPDQLVQQTAPVNKMRKLGMKAADRAKNRRLTYFPSRA